MQSLGEVLERLHTAWDRVHSAQGTMRFWYEPQRTRRAYEAWRHASPPGRLSRCVLVGRALMPHQHAPHQSSRQTPCARKRSNYTTAFGRPNPGVGVLSD